MIESPVMREKKMADRCNDKQGRQVDFSGGERVVRAFVPTRRKGVELMPAPRARRLTHEQIVKRWKGVFEPEFWDEVRRIAAAR
jgi:hypothetical protein